MSTAWDSGLHGSLHMIQTKVFVEASPLKTAIVDAQILITILGVDYGGKATYQGGMLKQGFNS